MTENRRMRKLVCFINLLNGYPVFVFQVDMQVIQCIIFLINDFYDTPGGQLFWMQDTLRAFGFNGKKSLELFSVIVKNGLEHYKKEFGNNILVKIDNFSLSFSCDGESVFCIGQFLATITVKNSKFIF